MHTATLQTGVIIGYNEIPILTVKPFHQRINDIKTLIQSIVHTEHPDKTEPNLVHYQEQKQLIKSFEVNH